MKNVHTFSCNIEAFNKLSVYKKSVYAFNCDSDKTLQFMCILSSEEHAILFIILRHRKQVIIYAYKDYLKQVTSVVSVDKLANVQRPFIKSFNNTIRLHRIKLKPLLWVYGMF